MKKTFITTVLILQLTQVLANWGNWGRYSKCSVSCGSGIKKRSRYCMKEPCKGSADSHDVCAMLACPTERKCNCGCLMTKTKDFFDTRMTYKSSGTCMWSIQTPQNTRIKLNIQDLQLGHGSLFINDPKDVHKKINKINDKTGNVPFTITSSTNVLNVTLYYEYSLTEQELKMRGNYQAVTVDKPEPPVAKPKDASGSSVNVPAIIGITACVIVILLASIILGHRKLSRRNEDKHEDVSEEGQEDNYSSASSSNRHKGLSPRHANRQRELSPTRKENGEEAHHGLLQSQLSEPRGYPDGTELFIPQNSAMVVATQAGYVTPQPYINWPIHQTFSEVDYRQAQPAGYIMKQANIAYTPQVMYEQPKTFAYPTSGAEG